MKSEADLRPVSVERRTEGGDGGPKMLLLHGLAANDSVWDRLLDGPLLSEGHEIWTARLPWRTESIADSGREPHLREWLARALAAVPGGADAVVAHSMAVNVLLDLLDTQERAGGDPLREYGIRRLVLVSPFYRSDADAFDWDTISYYLNDFHLIMEEGIRVHADGRLSADLLQAMGCRVRDRVGPQGWLRFFDLYLGTPELRLDRITVPTLVLAGENDFAAPPAEGVALAGALPHGTARVLSGCGHFPMIEATERFAAEIRQFTASAAAPAALFPSSAAPAHRAAGRPNALEPQR
ncbi:alpha/beta fold hydrolase [Streptomyces apocyni]|uniref:alpha/beta fold hydrolase n=1 Tax=Streptomyces apocyni TaxID=2654677 RepID=UPI001E350223|nr:alpha/beta hydrolase [Streptomyces apocyni]